MAAASRAETWIEPKAFVTHAVAAMDVDLREGAPWNGSSVPRLRERELSFTCNGSEDRQSVGGGDGREPAGVVRLEAPGLHVVALVLQPELIVLPADEFDIRLAASGHEDLVLARADTREDERDCRVRVARSAKALIMVGGAHSSGRDRPAGLPLELLLVDDTGEALRRGSVRVQLLEGGHAVPDALVSARSADTPSEVIEVSADSSGIATFPISAAGRWLLAAADVEALEADDESEWSLSETTLTFEVVAEPAFTPPAQARSTANP